MSNVCVSPDEVLAGSVEVHLDPGATLVRLMGEIDVALSAALEEAYDTVVARGAETQVDAYQVTFLDSVGVGFIARLASAERRQGRALTVFGSSRSMRETLVLSGVFDLLQDPGPHPGPRVDRSDR